MSRSRQSLQHGRSAAVAFSSERQPQASLDSPIGPLPRRQSAWAGADFPQSPQRSRSIFAPLAVDAFDSYVDGSRAWRQPSRQNRPPIFRLGAGDNRRRWIDVLLAPWRDGYAELQRGTGLEELARSLKAYFSEPYGLFLDGPGATLCEYWYLMNVNALAFRADPDSLPA